LARGLGSPIWYEENLVAALNNIETYSSTGNTGDAKIAGLDNAGLDTDRDESAEVELTWSRPLSFGPSMSSPTNSVHQNNKLWGLQAISSRMQDVVSVSNVPVLRHFMYVSLSSRSRTFKKLKARSLLGLEGQRFGLDLGL